MPEYLILIIGDDMRYWTESSEAAIAETMAKHEEFGTELAKRGHQITGGAELRPSVEARTLRVGQSTATEGPFAETTEQVGGYYTVQTDDLDDLVDVCRILGGLGDHLEIRRMVSDEDRASQS